MQRGIIHSSRFDNLESLDANQASVSSTPSLSQTALNEVFAFGCSKQNAFAFSAVSTHQSDFLSRAIRIGDDPACPLSQQHPLDAVGLLFRQIDRRAGPDHCRPLESRRLARPPGRFI
ncbi:hypothetical protein QA640_13185 [Bradyrhizobium sp. CB82]|uniref:hypothetical protein n=1 Tax=Bradyrhizobium sp. CB82 TaxID=3039159 RepID=UPI0024B08F58|nr:hypothetical protein [Bradyrhizobium sp. CB82]WFU43315.1 hypothetical protein QA640_13185 [Bradyrhizobium sp. CB82]